MKKHYEHRYSTYGGYAMNPKVGEDFKDVDGRIDRLEKLVRAHVLEPAGVPVGASMDVACAKATMAAKAAKALADVMKPAETKVELRKRVADLQSMVAELEDDNDTLAKQVQGLANEIYTLKQDLVSVMAERNFAKEELRKFREDAETKLRQLVTSLSQS